MDVLAKGPWTCNECFPRYNSQTCRAEHPLPFTRSPKNENSQGHKISTACSLRALKGSKFLSFRKRTDARVRELVGGICQNHQTRWIFYRRAMAGSEGTHRGAIHQAISSHPFPSH